MEISRRRDISLERRSLSISPTQRRLTPEYRERSASPIYRRHNGASRKSPNSYPYSTYKSHRQNSDYSDDRSSRCSGGGYDSDKEYHSKRDNERSPRWERQSSRERSRSKEKKEKDRDRHHRDRDYDSHRDRDRDREHRRDRRRNSWDRRSEESHRSRDRSDRSHRDDDRESIDSERSQNNTVIGASGSEIIGYKSQPPNNTIMIRGLAQHITENDVRQDIIQCGLMPKDIRLIRKKDTGASRGFAFVEFTTLQEATRWMEMKQGVLMLQDQYRAIMQYSIPKELCQQSEKPPSNKATADWFCIKCGAQNFKRRNNCFKCHASRMESEEGGSGSDEICTYATKTIMLRNLDALTTEDSVMGALNNTHGVRGLINSIVGVCIGRDPLTSTSRGICYLGLESTVDALALYSALTTGLSSPLSIDGKTIIVSYCKYHMGDVKRAFTQTGLPNANQPSVYTMSDLNTISDYSASKYAKNPVEYEQFFQYYKSFFAQQISDGLSITLSNDNQMDAANAAAAVAHSAIQQLNANKSFYDSMHIHIPNGTDGKRYPVPNISKFQLDKTSGYQFDPSTGLYFDPISHYYYNGVIQKYLYWDPEKLTYMLAPGDDFRMSTASTASASAGPIASTSAEGQGYPPEKKMKTEKQDKVKVAKKIAKDMERWAKTLNQKKETTMARSSNEPSLHTYSNPTASADIGFAVLEKKNVPPVLPLMKSDFPSASSTSAPVHQGHGTPLVAAYGGESDESGEEDVLDETDFLDYGKLICNLCKRQLGSKDALAKHVKLSTLHKQNLELRKAQRISEGKVKYRDRAKERRLKYGESDEPTPSKLKEKYLKSREIPESSNSSSTHASEPIGSENVGNRLLQKMGWTEGQGLGKSNQGRTSIIQAEQRNSTVGLGNKMASYTAMPGETYKDCVKKMMLARYQELSDHN